MSESAVMAAEYCTFWIDDLFFGIDVMQVQEVIRYQEMTDVPLASPVVRGLINLRGQIVTALDMRRCLGFADREDHLPMNIVIGQGDDAVSLLVDDIGDVVETDPADREELPPTIQSPLRDLVCATYKLPDRLLLVLDTPRVLAADALRTAPEGALQ